MHRSTLRSITSLAITVTALTALAACGSDDGDADGGTTTTAATTETTAPASSTPPAATLSAESCEAAITYGTVSSMAPEAPEEVGPWVTENLVPIGQQWVSDLGGDGELGEAAAVIDTTFAAVAESGDPSALFAPDAAAAFATIGEAVHEGCGLQPVDVQAIDYGYEGVPAELAAGPTSFALTNTGIEEHEMVLFKRADGATETLDEVLELPEEELFSKVQFTGVTFGSPDTTNYVALDLEPGTYFLVCFIPQGGGEDGPPHFMAGMKETIEVA